MLIGQPGTCVESIYDPDLWRSFTNVNTLADYASLTDELPYSSRS